MILLNRHKVTLTFVIILILICNLTLPAAVIKDYYLERLEIDLLFKKYQLTGDTKIKKELLDKINDLLREIENRENKVQIESKNDKKIGIRAKLIKGFIFITEVKDKSLAQLAGLQKGDKIVRINGEEVKGNLDFLVSRIKELLSSGKPIILEVEREGKTLKIKL